MRRTDDQRGSGTNLNYFFVKFEIEFEIFAVDP